VVGSVYIPPGDFSALALLDTVICNTIVSKYAYVIIAKDANSRSNLWDDSCLGRSDLTQSLQMGFILKDIISKHGLCVRNDGSPTFWSVSAPE